MEKIKNLIKNSKNIAIFFHINPDGDAIGSSIALKLALEKFGKNVDVYSNDLVPEYLSFLNKNYVNYNVTNKNYDLGFVLDCPEIKRIGNMEKVLNNCKNIINIDHHLSNSNFTNYLILNEKASSTCELIYNLLMELNINLTEEISLALYTGLATDSGCFMFNITENLHSICNNLLKNIKLDIEKINYRLFREKSVNEIKLYCEAIKKMELMFNNKLALFEITEKDFKNTNTSIDDTNGLVFMLSGIKNVNVICVYSEYEKGVYKVAFRSNNTDVCNLAKLFGGGGHKFASGCKLYGSKTKVKTKLLEKIKEFLCTE